MTDVRALSELTVDCGEGYEIRHGDRAGQIRWTRQPRARFECLLCGRREDAERQRGESIAEAVARFTATIRATHHLACTGQPTEREQAA